jgi:hypothetical protein
MYTLAMLETPEAEYTPEEKRIRGRMAVCRIRQTAQLHDARRHRTNGHLAMAHDCVIGAKRWHGQWRVLRGLLTGKPYRGVA